MDLQLREIGLGYLKTILEHLAWSYRRPATSSLTHLGDTQAYAPHRHRWRGHLSLTRPEANDLLKFISGRYESSSVILTSNKSVTEWPGVLGDNAIVTAILDRLLHHSHGYSIKGDSYRLRERAIAATQPAGEQPVATT